MSDGAPLPATSKPQMQARLLAGLLAMVAAALLVALIILVQSSNRQRDAALAGKQHSYEVVILTGQVEGSLARAEASLGRFVIDGDRRTGTLYYDEWRHAGALIDDLAVLTADDRAQAGRVRMLRALYARRGGELALPATRANYRQGWPALSLFARAGKSDTLPRMTAVLRDITRSAGALLGERATAAANRTDQANTLSRLLAIVGVMLGVSVVALGWLVITAMAERRRAAESAALEADRAAALARAVAERTAELSEANSRLLEEGRTRAAAEARLRQVQKMDAIGQLTGGIAHDFNNMLAVVVGGLELARKRLGAHDEEAARHIDSAMEGATRAAALTRRLLSFARAEPLLPGAASPAILLRGMSDLIDRSIGERIEVSIRADPLGWPVWVDAYQLENAILNLAVNARDAMNGVGKLLMSVTNVRLADGEIGSLAAGEYVRLSVADNGSGMSAATLERVFEPFFTTKPVGQGTGLGLSQILGFARQSGGDVALSSTLGEGTTVALYLPRHMGQAEGATQGATPIMRRARIDGTIMVVEDDARVRAATSAALAELGYTAVSCASGAEALERLKHCDDLALLMTDVMMPGMTGPELVRRVRESWPDTRILFVTGYVGEAGEAENFRGAAVLRKPFTLRALADALATAVKPDAEALPDVA